MFHVALVGPMSPTESKQWDYVLSHWRPQSLHLVGGMGEADLETYAFRGATPIPTLDQLPAMTSVLLAPQNGNYFRGNTSLASFTHPSECVYIFGSNNRHLTTDEAGDFTPDWLVYVPTETPTEMYSWCAASVTFYDRMVKHG